MSIPSVKVANLRQHFKETYRLADTQVDQMIESSGRSLRVTFEAAEDVLSGSGSDFFEKLGRHAHSMKGLLLNMGESEWAALAREIELAALQGREIDYRGKIEELRCGVL